MKEERKQPFVWPSWISKLIAGEDHCFWKVWFKSHFQKFDKTPNTFNSAAWVVAHTAMIRERTDNLEKLGYRVLLEDQNSFKWNYKGAVVSGRPDIVCFGRGHEIWQVQDERSSSSLDLPNSFAEGVARV